MKDNIELMLKPFVEEVHKQIRVLKDQFEVEKYHYGYGFSLNGTDHWKNNFDLKHLDFLIDNKDPYNMANLDILCRRFLP